MNRLGAATSPYLRQHADNPVHWQEWGPEAFAEAQRRDVPVLLSVGYAACHWCHVMAHESFADPATAELMNERFVSIKVDREERPDIDAVYMNATVAMTGQGGWPMTCFLTPAGDPFYCGTYYPKQGRAGLPSFSQVLEAISETWRTRRADVDAAASAAVTALRAQSAGISSAGPELSAELLDHAAAAVLRDFDAMHGGFGGAPKFPPSALLEGLLRSYERTGSAETLAAVESTLSAMGRGGIYDQLDGGFSRYSVDASWIVPHFEKMLYDNALLLRVYAHSARRTGSALARRISRETVQFLLTRLLTSDGGFASALDADTGGVEGATYVWNPEELAAVLGPDDGAWAAEVFGATAAGTFEGGTSVLQLPADPLEVERFSGVRDRLRKERDRRPQPARDDKVVTAWNGMAITALTEAGVALDEPEWVGAAARCARLLVNSHQVAGRLRRASLGGVAGPAPAVLEDYAWLASGLLALHQAEGDPAWLSEAEALLDLVIERFADPDQTGSWFDTADDSEQLLARPRDPLDGATPSGAAAVTEALLTASCLTSPAKAERYRALADAGISLAGVILARAPRSAGHWLAVAESAVRGPIQVALAGHSSQLLAAARAAAPGGAVIVAGQPDSSPLLADRPLVNGAPAAYVCRGVVCEMPVTSAADLTTLLAQ